MTGGRLNRFNIVKQSKDYDQHGSYVKHWLPELKDVPTEFVHEPWKMTVFQQTEYNVRLGVDYPHPIIPTQSGRSYDTANGNGKSHNHPTPKQRKPNQNNKNRGQKYEMKSVKTGGYDFK
jgi:deoxyribodipyrimidine photo-lyase